MYLYAFPFLKQNHPEIFSLSSFGWSPILSPFSKCTLVSPCPSSRVSQNRRRIARCGWPRWWDSVPFDAVSDCLCFLGNYIPLLLHLDLQAIQTLNGTSLPNMCSGSTLCMWSCEYLRGPSHVLHQTQSSLVTPDPESVVQQSCWLGVNSQLDLHAFLTLIQVIDKNVGSNRTHDKALCY